MGKLKEQLMSYYGTCKDSYDVSDYAQHIVGYPISKPLLPNERLQYDISHKFRFGGIEDENNNKDDVELDLYSYIKKMLNIRNNNIINILMLLYDKFGIENLFCTRFVITGTISRYSSGYFNFITTEYFIYKLLGEKYYGKCTDKIIDIFNNEETNINIINKSIKSGYHVIQLDKTNVLILNVLPYNNTTKVTKKENYLEKHKVSISETESGGYFDMVVNNYSQIYYEFIIVGNNVINHRKKLLKKFSMYFSNIKRKYYNSSSLYATFSIEPSRVVELGSSSLSSNDIKHFIYPDMKTEIARIETFIKNYDILNKFNAVTKYSILLYGEPGTGKSTFAKYIAVKFGLNIYDLRFNIDDENPLLSGFENSPRNRGFNPSRSVILIDELDLFVQNNYLDDSNSRNEINNKRVQFIIKFLDGLSGGNIVVATTNNINIIDKRLLRPGRFDIIKELKPIHKSKINEYLESYKSEVSLDNVKQKIHNEHESDYITTAELSNYILVEKLDEIGLSEIYKRNEGENNG